MEFIITTRAEMHAKGLDALDFIMISGDAYVDHPSFGAALICRLLERQGYSVGIIAQPDWKDQSLSSFAALGKPRLGFLVTSGNIDSMVNHYTAAKKRRSNDAYSPNGEAGKRPDRAAIVYCVKLRQLYKDVPIIAGGIEASLRRLSHYDYWSDSVRRSFVMDSNCDLLVYGMGEKQITKIAEKLALGEPVSSITDIPGTAYKSRELPEREYIMLPSYELVSSDKSEYVKSFRIQYDNTDAITAKTLAEPYGGVFVIQNPPAEPLNRSELDSVYSMRFANAPHPSYTEKSEPIPAIEEVKFSITSCRGCFGSCSFCALTFHQGRRVSSRSHKSIIEEARRMTKDPDFKGYIHDVGGPTANFRQPACSKQNKTGACRDRRCLYPSPCNSLEADHSDYIKLLGELRSLPSVKKVFIRSGIRFDYLLADKKSDFLEQLVEHHVSGQLKIAPEHVSDSVLSLMGKPGRKVYEEFTAKYEAMNKKLGKKQFIVPYLMSSHPGSTLSSAIELAEYLNEKRLSPEQVQDFYPTPGTVSTCMFYTEINPFDGKKVYVAKSPNEKAMQRALIQYRLPQNRVLVLQALKKAGRTDLIGFGKNCLIRPEARTFTPDKKPASKTPKKTIRNIHKKKK